LFVSRLDSVIGTPFLLWWNEGNEVQALKGLASVERSVISASPAVIDQNLNEKLIYLAGDLTSKVAPRDEMFGIPADGQARLQRHVEMYQRETSLIQRRKNSLTEDSGKLRLTHMTRHGLTFERIPTDSIILRVT
jgi:hypothetical protein